MAKDNIFGWLMGIPERRYGREGYTYFIKDKYTDRVISCWAVGTKDEVTALAIQSADKMSKRDNRNRLENKHQKTQTMKSSSYGHVTPSANKLRGLETS